MTYLKDYWFSVVVLGVLIIAEFISVHNQQLYNLSQKQILSAQQNIVDAASTNIRSDVVTSSWDGILKNSDNLNKGNLILITGEHKIYIKTVRDFNSVLDKNVTLNYSGNLEKFILNNITSN